MKFENDSEIHISLPVAKSRHPNAKGKIFFFFIFWRRTVLVSILDGTPLEIYVFLGKKKNIMNVFTTYYFLHTKKVLRSNILEDEVTEVLSDGQKLVSFIKQKLFHLRIFQKTV